MAAKNVNWWEIFATADEKLVWGAIDASGDVCLFSHKPILVLDYLDFYGEPKGAVWDIDPSLQIKEHQTATYILNIGRLSNKAVVGSLVHRRDFF